jgi:hypothetical protein
MCDPVSLGIASIAASVGGSIYSAQAQNNAAKDASANSFAASLANAQAQTAAAQANARAQEEIARQNAESALQIAQMNALADQTAAIANIEAINATALANAQIAESNALRFEAAATAQETAGRAEEERRRTRAQFLLADQRARYGASGVTIEGSPLEVLAFSAGQEELDALTIRFNSGTRVNDLTMEAAATRLEGALGVQTAGFQARNLLRDALLRGETGINAARISGRAGIDNALTAGRAGVTNALLAGRADMQTARFNSAATLAAGRASATGTLISGFSQGLNTGASLARENWPRPSGNAKKSFHFANSSRASSGMDV